MPHGLCSKVLEFAIALSVLALFNTNRSMLAFAQEQAHVNENSPRIDLRPKSDIDPQQLIENGYKPVDLAKIITHLDTANDGPHVEFASSQFVAELIDNQLYGVAQLHLVDVEDRAIALDSFSPAVLAADDKLHPDGHQWAVPAGFTPQGAAIYETMKHDQLAIGWLQRPLATSTTNELRFRLNIPWATTSQFRLHLPAGWIVSNSSSPFHNLDESHASAWRMSSERGTSYESHFTFDCGAQTLLEFTLIRSRSNSFQSKLLFKSEQVDWIIQSAGLEVTSNFVIDAIATPVEIEIDIDPRLRVRNLTWDQQKVNWVYDHEKRLIRFSPNELEGLSALSQHRLVVAASSAWPLDATDEEKSGALQSLPQIRIHDALAIEGRGSISLHSDWELIDFQLDAATISSRSGTDLRGAMSRIDFAWAIQEPEVRIDIAPRPRTKKAVGLYEITNRDDHAEATFTVRLTPSVEPWNRLFARVSPPWKLDSVRTLSSDITLRVNDVAATDQSTTIEILTDKPVENQRIDLEFKLLTTQPMQASEQAGQQQRLQSPQPMPVLLDGFQVDAPVVFQAQTGYVLSTTFKSIQASTNPIVLDPWQTSLLDTTAKATVLPTDYNRLPVIEFERQQSDLSIRTVTVLRREKEGYRARYSVECTPEETSVQQMDIAFPNVRWMALWRLIDAKGKVIQDWQRVNALRQSANEETEDATTEVMLSRLRFDNPVSEPFVVECTYSTLTPESVLQLPSVQGFKERQSALVVPAGFEPLVKVDSVFRYKQQVTSAMKDELLAVASLSHDLDESNDRYNAYILQNDERTVELRRAEERNDTPVVEQSTQRLYLQSDGSYLLEMTVDLGGTDVDELNFELPMNWKLVGIQGDVGTLPYTATERSGLRVWNVSLRSNVKREMPRWFTVRWVGEKAKYSFGRVTATQPKLVTNFISLVARYEIWSADTFAIFDEANASSSLGIQSFGDAWNWIGLLFNPSPAGLSSLQQRTESSSLLAAIERQKICLSETAHFVSHTKQDTEDGSAAAQTCQMVDVNSLLILRWIYFLLSAFFFAFSIRIHRTLPLVLLVLMLVVLIRIGPTPFAGLVWFGAVTGIFLAFLRLILRQPAQDSSQSSRTLYDDRAVNERRSAFFSALPLFAWIALCLLSILQPAYGQESDGESLASTEPDVVIPIDMETMQLQAPFQRTATLGEDGLENESFIIKSADHLIEYRNDRIRLNSRSAIMTSRYVIEVQDASTQIEIPWSLSDAFPLGLYVNGKPERYNSNLESRQKYLIWRPQSTGSFELMLQTQLTMKAQQSVGCSIIPCGAATMALVAEATGAKILAADSVIDNVSSTPTPLGPASRFELSWPNNSTFSTAAELPQYDLETQLILRQNTPLAVTHIRAKGLGTTQSIAIEWSKEWTPIGNRRSDIAISDLNENFSVGKSRASLQVDSADGNVSGNVDLEIYWRPSNDGFVNLPLPNLRVVDARLTSHLLTLPGGTRDMWTVDGISSWTPVAKGLATSSTVNGTEGTSSVSFRVPEVSSTAVIRRRSNENLLPDARVSNAYIANDTQVKLLWRGKPVRSSNNDMIQSWIIDRDLEVDSVQINETEVPFSVSSVNDEFNRVKAFVDPKTENILNIQIRSRKQLSDAAPTRVPLIFWEAFRVVQSEYQLSKVAGAPLQYSGLPENCYILNKIENPSESEIPMPVEMVCTGEEAVPRQIESDNGTLAIPDRELSRVTISLERGIIHKNAFTAQVDVRENSWTLDFRGIISPERSGGIVLAIDKSIAAKFQWNTNVQLLSESGNEQYWYIEPLSSPDSSAQAIQAVLMQDFSTGLRVIDLPEIKLIGLADAPVYLSIKSDESTNRWEWDVDGWQETNTTQQDELKKTALGASAQKFAYVAYGRLAPTLGKTIAVESVRPEVKLDITSLAMEPSAHIVTKDIWIQPGGAKGITIQALQDGVSVAARNRTSVEAARINQWKLAGPLEQGGRGIELDFEDATLPHWISISAYAPDTSSQTDVDALIDCVRIFSSDGEILEPQQHVKILAGGSTAWGQLDASVPRISTDDAADNVLGVMTDLLQPVTASLSSRATESSDAYLRTWASTYLNLANGLPRDKLDVRVTDYQRLFGSLTTSRQPLAATSTLPRDTTSLHRLFSNDDSDIIIWSGESLLDEVSKHQNPQPSSDLIRWQENLLWMLPLLVLTLALANKQLIDGVQQSIHVAPWRLLVLVALMIAAFTHFYWVSLSVAVVGFAQVTYSYIYNRFNLSS